MADTMLQSSIDVHKAPGLRLIREHLAREGLSDALDLLPNVSEFRLSKHGNVLGHGSIVPLSHKLQIHLGGNREHSISTFVYLNMYFRTPPGFVFGREKSHLRKTRISALSTQGSPAMTRRLCHVSLEQMNATGNSTFSDEVAGALKLLHTPEQIRKADDQARHIHGYKLATRCAFLASPIQAQFNAWQPSLYARVEKYLDDIHTPVPFENQKKATEEDDSI
ncbi:hypothetical protein P171DRAFT_444679 [Karstenula rhodostoma CBS 690.94]|uniref:Uncharacterized protein n=1 Tax=Karstenula rhodostoma CBS 690.94 TaxID=1392251 RepID=A0A9P4PHZ6_9PLEO|nr:hypothetical protein P171DRAFT_444679 [Karstenula rhodostoma CBS 690.94]